MRPGVRQTPMRPHGEGNAAHSGGARPRGWHAPVGRKGHGWATAKGGERAMCRLCAERHRSAEARGASRRRAAGTQEPGRSPRATTASGLHPRPTAWRDGTGAESASVRDASVTDIAKAVRGSRLPSPQGRGVGRPFRTAERGRRAGSSSPELTRERRADPARQRARASAGPPDSHNPR